MCDLGRKRTELFKYLQSKHFLSGDHQQSCWLVVHKVPDICLISCEFTCVILETTVVYRSWARLLMEGRVQSNPSSHQHFLMINFGIYEFIGAYACVILSDAHSLMTLLSLVQCLMIRIRNWSFRERGNGKIPRFKVTVPNLLQGY